jgi:energy-coupling factor transporter ATP-binding protein EcfA2
MEDKRLQHHTKLVKRRITMIKELFLKNFRGIKTGHLKDFSQVNILLGPNNSGKSTILESLYLVSSMSKGEVIHKNNYLPGIIPETDFLGYDPLIRLRDKHRISTWENNPGIFEDGLIKVNIKEKSWQISPYQKEKKVLSFKPEDENRIGYCAVDYTRKRLTTDAQANEKKWLSLVLTEKELEKLPEKGRAGLLWFQKFTYENEKIAAIAAGITENFPSGVLFFDLFTAMEHMKNQFFENTLYSVPGWMDEIKERFGNIFPNGDFQIVFAPDETDRDLMRAHIAPKGRTGLSVDLLGDGARSMFKFLAFLAAFDDGGLILWEDPELFQHPDTLERSLKEIVNICQKKNFQLFLCTQSLEVLALFRDMIEEKILSSQDVRGYFTDLREGTLQYRQYTGETLAGWIEMNLDPRRKNQFEGKFIYKVGEEE